MRSIYIASTEGSGGKTTVAIGLALALRERGLRVGYFKPIGLIGAGEGRCAEAADPDAVFAADVLGLPEDPSELCPVQLDHDALDDVLAGAQVDALDRVTTAFGRLRGERDLLICEGLGEIWQGRFMRTSGADIVHALDLETLLVARYAGVRVLDDICYVRDVLRERLAGVVFTSVPGGRMEVVRGRYAAFLGVEGVETLGVIEADGELSSVSVDDIACSLGATYVCGDEHGDLQVQSYLIGAMSPEHARRYFAETPAKAVVVGGDRAEIILAALETATAAVVLTGGIVPSATVLGRAQELGVPMLSVATDTVDAVDGIRRLFGRLGGHDRRKVDRAAALVAAGVDVDRLAALLED